MNFLAKYTHSFSGTSPVVAVNKAIRKHAALMYLRDKVLPDFIIACHSANEDDELVNLPHFISTFKEGGCYLSDGSSEDHGHVSEYVSQLIDTVIVDVCEHFMSFTPETIHNLCRQVWDGDAIANETFELFINCYLWPL